MPLGEEALITALCYLSAPLAEEVVMYMMTDKFRLGFVMLTSAIYTGSCVATFALAQSMWGVSDDDQTTTSTPLGVMGIPLVVLFFVTSKPLAAFVRPGQPCGARLRRTVRELWTMPLHTSVAAPSLTVLLYVYMTVFRRHNLAMDILIMGLGLPLLQVACMSVAARLMASEETGYHLRKGASHVKVQVQPAELLSEAQGCKGAGHGEAPEKNSKGAHLSLLMVVMAETYYSTGAFATLALAESTPAMIASLVLMLSIEVVHRALHVKARHVVSRVVAEKNGAVVLADNSRLVQWLMHQELGEKIGVQLALGFLAIDKTLGRDVSAVNAVSMTRLAYRGLAIVLLELAGDLVKDLLTQWLGVFPPSDSPSAAATTRVSMSALGATFIFSQACCAAFVVQASLALGT